MLDESQYNEKMYRKYLKLKNQFNSIGNRIDNLNNKVSSLKAIIEENILVDDKCLEEENLDDIVDTLNDISSSIKGNIIYKINSEMLQYM